MSQTIRTPRADGSSHWPGAFLQSRGGRLKKRIACTNSLSTQLYGQSEYFGDWYCFSIAKYALQQRRPRVCLAAVPIPVEGVGRGGNIAFHLGRAVEGALGDAAESVTSCDKKDSAHAIKLRRMFQNM